MSYQKRTSWIEREIYIFPCLHIQIYVVSFFKMEDKIEDWVAATWSMLTIFLWHQRGFLLIGTPWCFHMQIQKYLDYYRGNAIFQLEKSYIWFLKKEIKRIYYQLYFWTSGQMRSGKWTGREAQKTQLYCLNVVIYVHKSGEHSAETHYNGAMKQWRICRGFT